VKTWVCNHLTTCWGWSLILLLGLCTVVDAHPPVTQLLESYECTRCHRLNTPHRLIGPSLWKIGERADAAFIRAAILTPDAVVKPGYPAGLMRTRLQELGFYVDIKRQPEILERIVAYLSGHAQAVQIPDLPASTSGMVRIEAGQEALPDGQQVEVAAFMIDATPVSTSAYGAFIAAGGYQTKRYWDRSGWAVVVQRRNRSAPLHWETQQRAATQPVVGVSWYEADAYCRWAGKALPSEAQWQHACQTVDGWNGSGGQHRVFWEWTATAAWKGGTPQNTCRVRVPSYPALDGQHTGFRCVAIASHP
jgi:hypothetical protein